MTNYDWLISRLDAFIRKYYANQVLRGSLIFLICLLFYILTVSVSEYYLYLPVWLRITAVSALIILGLSALIAWVIIPLAKMARLGGVISHEQAAMIIGRHFPEISDKLLNILQLKRHPDVNTSRELIEASIDQKASQISVIPITSAVDLSKNKKYLPFLLPLLLIGVFILVAAPNVFRDASQRLFQPTRTFEKPAPFQFIIQSGPLQVVRNADFTLKVEVKGAALPNELSVEIGNERVPMQVLEQHHFQYTFRNVTEPVTFRLFAAGFYSHTYTIRVAQKPVLKAFKVQIDYPDYTGKKDELRTSLGDMTLPVGTTVRWVFIAEHTDNAYLKFGNGAPLPIPGNNTMFASQYRFMNDTSYAFILHNRQAAITDSYRYQVQVIPDQYPVLQVQQFRDTISGKQILLSGTAGDDYRINSVLFHYQVSNGKDQVLLNKGIPLKITPGALTTFEHYFDIQMLNLQQGQKLSYYVEAWDNDGVHGSKASRSEVMTYQMFNDKQLDSAINQNAQQINSGLSNSAQKSQQLQNEFKDMQSKMLQSDKLDWQQQQSMQEMVQKQQQLQAQVENIKKRLEEQIQQSQQKQVSQDIKDKQQELEKQMDNLLNNELKEQMKKLQELMQKLNKDNAFQTMQQMEQDNKLFDMDLQRMQELMKKLEMQMRMEDMANKLDQLAKKQLDLKSQTEENKKGNASLNKEQQALKNELDKAMEKDMKELQKINEQSQQKESLKEEQKEGQDAQQEMQQSEEQLEQNQNSKSGQSQSKAAQNMQQMAQSMRQKAGGMDMEEIDMDIRAVRQILTNLMRLSFDQEHLMKTVQQTSLSSQAYLANEQDQHRLHANSRMIRDSLFVLSKRLFKLSAMVNKETTELERNMGSSVDALEARRVGDAVVRQQYVMTHTNNLALMLNEILSNLIQMQNQAKQGSCSKPGGGMPKPGKGKSPGPGLQLGDIITKQQEMGNAMQQMQNAMQKGQGKGKGEKPGDSPGGKAPGGKTPGGKSGEGGSGNGGSGNGTENGNSEYGNAEQLARMAEQQAAIRRQLQELNSLLNSKGMGNNKELKEVQDKMDRNETDLVNRRFSNDLMLRQKEILTHLMEAEKSLREQEQDDKRSSRSAQEISRPVPPELQKYMQDRKQLLELYKTVPPQLKPYYRSMVEQYYQMIGTR